ncbi:gamma-glutamyl-gamma-aminobutyraldehyde dehydrogenase [Angulomicrobium tetraedrale]|uniref:Gamma-glutamyl-gamma-aminobutyraldehyde dehydrogenase n=1 Tax=Ancylobacter tetraedralis TaxID=217068 RepID=A0A839ZAS2_9HYPH|nr:aldehyde dehydrogenase [Ancylobacter tetraedralis]MBB3771816.1 gamma-glutamyl-gamma-aminobutyraldehyde dehydrogenase [Ancylobacter tetraedralis]
MSSLPPGTHTQAFIDGAFVAAENGALFDDLDPATGRLLVRVAACSPADVDTAVKAARAAFRSGVWSRMEPRARKKILLRFADLVEANGKEIALLDSIDAGKPISDCENLDLPDVVNNIRWYAEAIDKVFGKISPTGDGNLGLVTREPVGVVGMVLPWNFPAGTLSWKISPALAAGNSIVVKPAELAPLSTLKIAELALEAGIPAGVFNVVPGLGHVAGKALGLHADVDVISFTGSTEIGRQFLRYSADSNLKKVVLECGGKSPQIVMADVGGALDAIAENLAGAAFWNMGQNCTCGSRILVQSSIKDAFVAKLVEAARGWVVGPPTDPASKLGPLIEASALERVVGAIEQAKAQGSRVVAGGNRLFPESGGWFVEPTIIDDVDPASALARDEIFGPVVAVLGFESEEEAVRLANDTAYGLAATVFSNDINVAMRMARSIQAGTVAVNGYGEGDITTPFGGYKTSGFGGYDKGIEAFDQYTQLKTIWVTLA